MKKGKRKAVMAIIVNDFNKVLIGTSPRDGGFKFPQGGLEPNEDIINGIKRELFEELSLTINDQDIIDSYSEKVTYVYPNEEKYIYSSQELSIVKIKHNDTMVMVPQDDEFDELFWIAPKDLPKYNTSFRAKAYQKAILICGLQ
jgi:8-oxo-dGTP pyrophosphatase MutT (NUDIX family)